MLLPVRWGKRFWGRELPGAREYPIKSREYPIKAREYPLNGFWLAFEAGEGFEDTLFFDCGERVRAAEFSASLFRDAVGQVARSTAAVLYFSGSGRSEAFFNSFVRFQFRHFSTEYFRLSILDSTAMNPSFLGLVAMVREIHENGKWDFTCKRDA